MAMDTRLAGSVAHANGCRTRPLRATRPSIEIEYRGGNYYNLALHRFDNMPPLGPLLQVLRGNLRFVLWRATPPDQPGVSQDRPRWNGDPVLAYGTPSLSALRGAHRHSQFG